MEILNYTVHSIKDLQYTGIYKIEHISKPSKIYIGSASGEISKNGYFGFLRRWMRHLTELKNNKHHNKKLQRVVNKYGIKGLIFSIIEICDPKLCQEKEDCYINFYNSYKNGFNLTLKANSSFGTKHKKSTLKKMSKAQKGKIISRESIEKANLTKKTKRELGLIYKPKNRFLSKTRKNSKKVYVYTREGEPFVCCYSTQDCDKLFDISKGKTSIYISLKTFIKKQYFPSYVRLNKEEVLNRVKEISQSRSDRNYRMWKKRKNKKIPC